MTVLCLVELDGAEPADASLRALTLARNLAGTSVQAVVFGESAHVPASVLAAYGVSDVYVVEPGAVDGYAPQAWARVLAGLAAETGATAVLAAGTDRGNEVLAHLGAITELPMAANCTIVTPDGGQTHRLVRHRWAGLLLEDAVMEAPIALFTVATDAVALVSAETPAALQVHVHKPELAEGDLRVRAVEAPAGAGGASLATARVVVGGGRGVGGPDGFAPLEELAGLLGGVVGVSRVVTSEGWRPHKQQVGQTGTKITPELYLACGISGAIQHIAGCAGAKHIIAINTDPGAPILAHADYAVIGDLHQVIPALVAALRARLGHSAPPDIPERHRIIAT
jgi:electron transfer flavoprotein alpha subunit